MRAVGPTNRQRLSAPDHCQKAEASVGCLGVRSPTIHIEATTSSRLAFCVCVHAGDPPADTIRPEKLSNSELGQHLHADERR
jgi:hypothetical protein